MQTQRQGGRQPPDQANSESAERKAATVHIHHRHFIITQPESWYSFYRPAEGGRLSQPRSTRHNLKTGHVTLTTPVIINKNQQFLQFRYRFVTVLR